MGRPAKNLSGQRFGHLVAISRDTTRCNADPKAVSWNCQCDCGNIAVIAGTKLTAKRYPTISCGCANRWKPNPDREDQAYKDLFSRYKYKAKARGYDFLLKYQEFKSLCKQNCHYCGSRPSRKEESRGGVPAIVLTGGVDRKNNKVGYLLDNCVPCCEDCNIGKFKRTEEAFLKWAERIVAFQRAKISPMGP